MTNCAYCYNGPVCGYCVTGFYKTASGICSECKFPCLRCYNSTYCYSCENVSLLYVRSSSTCYKCNQIYSAGCLTCSYVNIPSNSTCHSCISGYYLDGLTCTLCPSPCLTCSSATVCNSCNSTDYAFNSGACSLCSVSMPNCLTCLSTTLCQTCASGFFLNANPNSCVPCNSYYPNCTSCILTACTACDSGFIVSGGRCIAWACSSPCKTCSPTSTSCLSCIEGYYFDSGLSLCQLCDPTCVACTALTTCTKCHPDLLLSGTACVACPPQQYHNIYTFSCQPCSAHCSTCLMSSGCTSCEPFFSLQLIAGTSRCIDICGDGFAMDVPCDLGSGIKHDGCTDKCQIEPNYICTNTSGPTIVNGITYTTNKSGCSFTGQVQAELTAASSSLFAN